MGMDGFRCGTSTIPSKGRFVCAFSSRTTASGYLNTTSQRSQKISVQYRGLVYVCRRRQCERGVQTTHVLVVGVFFQVILATSTEVVEPSWQYCNIIYPAIFAATLQYASPSFQILVSTAVLYATSFGLSFWKGASASGGVVASVNYLPVIRR